MAWENAEADIMNRQPRDQKTDRLVTRKLVCFAYLQIGVIQAIAGFYSYLVVLGDYGYYSYTLPGLGNDDAWQKIQLMCKVDGGVLRNIDGMPYESLAKFEGDQFKEVNNAFAQGYMYWDWQIAGLDANSDVHGSSFKEGVVHDCIHVPRTINNDGDEPSGFNWAKPTTFLNNMWKNDASNSQAFTTAKNVNVIAPSQYSVTKSEADGTTSYTAGRATSSVNHIMAMKKAGWIEYQPFAARMSSFFDKNWQYWEPLCGKKTCPYGGSDQVCCGVSSSVNGVSTIQGYGTSTPAAHFAGTPIGHRILPMWATYKAGTATWPGEALEFLTGDTDKVKSYYLGGKVFPKTEGGKTVFWKDDAFYVPTFREGTNGKPYLHSLFGDGKKCNLCTTADAALPECQDAAGALDITKCKGIAGCTSFTVTDDTVTADGNANCLTSEWALPNSLYSWAETDSKDTTSFKMEDTTLHYRVNVVNRMMQREALAYAQTSGFTTIIVVQWADLMICKTRWLSIRQQGMRNKLMNFGLLFETILGAAVAYVPFLNVALTTRPLRFTHWFPGMPFMVLIFFYDEVRKYIMRSTATREKDPVTHEMRLKQGWVGRNTYY